MKKKESFDIDDVGDIKQQNAMIKFIAKNKKIVWILLFIFIQYIAIFCLTIYNFFN